MNSQKRSSRVATAPRVARATAQKNVVYLFGAGASHASASWRGAPSGLLTKDLAPEMAKRLRRDIDDDPAKYTHIVELVNSVVGSLNGQQDVEHLITFLAAAPTRECRDLAETLRGHFVATLRIALRDNREKLGSDPTQLYEAVYHLHTVKRFGEHLRGILTLNYDTYAEEAHRKVRGTSPDMRIGLRGSDTRGERTPLIKLHGSFGWRDSWPIEQVGDDEHLWIPPGIAKSKERYPFNLLWGAARELLECDVLRVVGCRLGANDWDLVSLLFSTIHARSPSKAYTVEIINSPIEADEIRVRHPYLHVRSMLDLEHTGDEIVSDLIGGAPRPAKDLGKADLERLNHEMRHQNVNWMHVWLRTTVSRLRGERSSRIDAIRLDRAHALISPSYV